ncbi:hypothetical protein E1B28_008135 [Marasmius oreades]|uniref:Uncharacterized protein n=1 Tax=Marasmius oreades TaxID=181124 RepID=A0A9P7RXQ1_9AGAR|nr:uncharacterized protein E1B28_008135 [Marasmius oreades]KAG7091734.1 hypothetical protein E1B28_008135 [Marasmius oreades]
MPLITDFGVSRLPSRAMFVLESVPPPPTSTLDASASSSRLDREPYHVSSSSMNSPLKEELLESRFADSHVLPQCTHCDITPDVFFLSSDGFLLGAHESNLRHYTGKLSRYTDFHIRQQLRIVPMPGCRRDIVKILLAFTHPAFTKDESIGKSAAHRLVFLDLIRLAYAAEKYQVWLAMRVAKMLVEEYAQHYPHHAFMCYVWYYQELDPAYPIIPRALARVPKARMEVFQRYNPVLYHFWELLKAPEC